MQVALFLAPRAATARRMPSTNRPCSVFCSATGVRGSNRATTRHHASLTTRHPALSSALHHASASRLPPLIALHSLRLTADTLPSFSRRALSLSASVRATSRSGPHYPAQPPVDQQEYADWRRTFDESVDALRWRESRRPAHYARDDADDDDDDDDGARQLDDDDDDMDEEDDLAAGALREGDFHAFDDDLEEADDEEVLLRAHADARRAGRATGKTNNDDRDDDDDDALIEDEREAELRAAWDEAEDDALEDEGGMRHEDELTKEARRAFADLSPQERHAAARVKRLFETPGDVRGFIDDTTYFKKTTHKLFNSADEEIRYVRENFLQGDQSRASRRRSHNDDVDHDDDDDAAAAASNNNRHHHHGNHPLLQPDLSRMSSTGMMFSDALDEEQQRAADEMRRSDVEARAQRERERREAQRTGDMKGVHHSLRRSGGGGGDTVRSSANSSLFDVSSDSVAPVSSVATPTHQVDSYPLEERDGRLYYNGNIEIPRKYAHIFADPYDRNDRELAAAEAAMHARNAAREAGVPGRESTWRVDGSGLDGHDFAESLTRRQMRVGEKVRRALEQALVDLFDAQYPHLRHVVPTIESVLVAKDMRSAEITWNAAESRSRIQRILVEHASRLRHIVTQRMQPQRYSPELKFVVKQRDERRERVLQVISKLEEHIARVDPRSFTEKTRAAARAGDWDALAKAAVEAVEEREREEQQQQQQQQEQQPQRSAGKERRRKQFASTREELLQQRFRQLVGGGAARRDGSDE